MVPRNRSQRLRIEQWGPKQRLLVHNTPAIMWRRRSHNPHNRDDPPGLDGVLDVVVGVHLPACLTGVPAVLGTVVEPLFLGLHVHIADGPVPTSCLSKNEQFNNEHERQKMDLPHARRRLPMGTYSPVMIWSEWWEGRRQCRGWDWLAWHLFISVVLERMCFTKKFRLL